MIDALVIVQKKLPAAMRSGSLGAPSTPAGARGAEIAKAVSKSTMLPVKNKA